jgi:mevalonate pyrophosphate decarboxylase
MGVEGTTDENSNIPSNVSLSLSLSLSLSPSLSHTHTHLVGFISSKLHDTKIMNGLDDIES